MSVTFSKLDLPKMLEDIKDEFKFQYQMKLKEIEDLKIELRVKDEIIKALKEIHKCTK